MSTKNTVNIRIRTDFVITNCGTIVLFTPQTGKAKAWMDRNVHSEGYQWIGGTLAVGHRYARPLAEGIVAAGFRL